VTGDDDARRVLRAACRSAGLDDTGAEVIRLGENAIFRLPGHVVARIAREGQADAAAREVNIARWLEGEGIDAVRVQPDVDQPVAVDGRAVTFWRELPAHRPGTPAQVAAALHRLHDLDPPTGFDLGRIAPFVRLVERIDRASTLTEDDREWMRNHLAELEQRWSGLLAGLPWCVVHGDAWVGNVVAAEDGTVLFLDLERCSLGPPEWDLVHTAIKYSSFAWISVGDYQEYCRVYGHDVAGWAGFALLRDIREFRMTCMAAQVAAENPAGHDQAAHRLACLRGQHGERPWPGWQAVP
jgi:aminoglycoside phosphotransferase